MAVLSPAADFSAPGAQAQAHSGIRRLSIRGRDIEGKQPWAAFG
jgi:hypothetical protein